MRGLWFAWILILGFLPVTPAYARRPDAVMRRLSNAELAKLADSASQQMRQEYEWATRSLNEGCKDPEVRDELMGGFLQRGHEKTFAARKSRAVLAAHRKPHPEPCLE